MNQIILPFENILVVSGVAGGKDRLSAGGLD